MPRREEPRRELITREFQKGNFITREKWEWEQGDKRIASYDKWNEEIVSECLNLQKKLKSENIEIIIEPRSFRNLTEGIGFEKFSDNRNYLAKEVVEVTLGTKKTVYFSGKYTTLAELITAIKNDIIDAQRDTSDAIDKGDGDETIRRGSRGTITRNGRERKETRPRKNTREGGEVSNELQPRKRRTRDNPIPRRGRGNDGYSE